MPLVIQVNTAKDILSAIEWVKERKIENPIFSGVAEGWRVADEIAEAGIPCLVGPVLSTPTRGSDRFDKPYQNVGLMHKAGVKVAIRTGESENVRNLPFNAGFAAAYGMGREDAMRAVTITPAEIFGVSDMLGSLEVGKKANVIVADGDPFEQANRLLKIERNLAIASQEVQSLTGSQSEVQSALSRVEQMFEQLLLALSGQLHTEEK